LYRLIKNIASTIIELLPVRMAERLLVMLEARIGIGTGGGPHQSGERVLFVILNAIRKEKLVIFDVGANQGQYTSELLLGLSENQDCSIHCFEPSKNTFQLLSQKHESNKRVRLNNFGLSNLEKHSTLYMDKLGSGLASLTERRLEHFGKEHGAISEEVKLRTLDSYAEEQENSHIDLLKIDVEGHELKVLSGAERFLKENRIDLIQFEFGGCNIDTRSFFQDFFYFFQGYDFKLYRILSHCKLLEIPKYREIDEKFRTMNYLAVNKNFKFREKFKTLIK
jgi:FkbM family methyltransferase